MARPVHKIRSGPIEVAIWRNEGERGAWYSVTPSRSYKQGEEWKQSDSFKFEDLLTLAKLLDMAHSWIMGHQQGAQPESPAEEEAA